VGTANSRLTCKYQYTSTVKRYIQHRTVGKIEDVFNDKEDYGCIHEREFVQYCR
jgi:hypothetical protein